MKIVPWTFYKSQSQDPFSVPLATQTSEGNCSRLKLLCHSRQILEFCARISDSRSRHALVMKPISGIRQAAWWNHNQAELQVSYKIVFLKLVFHISSRLVSESSPSRAWVCSLKLNSLRERLKLVSFFSCIASSVALEWCCQVWKPFVMKSFSLHWEKRTNSFPPSSKRMASLGFVSYVACYS